MNHTYSRYHAEQIAKARMTKIATASFWIAIGLFIAFEFLLATSKSI